MPQKAKIAEQHLIRRYLLWCYKTTKEELDRIDRKFTQLVVDEEILKILRRQNIKLTEDQSNQYAERLASFEQYIEKKRTQAHAEKFSDHGPKSLQADYLYLKNRLTAIEQAAQLILGKNALTQIQTQYEGEMRKRILESREGS